MSLIAPWEQSRWITLSSCLFMIPSYYAYLRELYAYSILLLITSLVSINYWRNATYSWRRTLDMIVAKITVTVFISNGTYYIRDIPTLIVGYTNLIPLVYCYYLSDKYHKAQNPRWVVYHCGFHFVLFYEVMLLIHTI
jgi:hypothetical protein